MSYIPPKEILEKYADLLVNCALNSGEGIKKGEVVNVQLPECAKPFLKLLLNAVTKAGGHTITQYLPDGISKEFFDLAEEHQLNFFPEKYLRGKVDEIHHLISIEAEHDMQELKDVDPKKIMQRQKAFKPFMEWRNKKENEGNFTWVLALYGTEAMAKEANLSLEEYWEQIIKACYLDKENPVEEWKRIFKEVDRTKDELNKLPIKSLNVKAEGVGLKIGVDKNRQWLGGTGRNIPSFEVYISPDWRKTEGHIKFDQPLYRYGVLIEGIELEFKEGKVVKATATKNENFLKEMIAAENADKVGEFSLTDKRLSRIDKFMADTLFDENFGGEFGNTHIALGNAYQDSYPGDSAKVKDEEWEEMGYNKSIVHTDIVSTKNRTVTATLESGEEKVIYKDGQFQI